jgi:hypothetical protein
MQMWQLYKPSLMSLTGKRDEDIVISVSNPSPVKDTYDLVDEFNNSEQASMISVRLYVGE